MDLDRLRDPEVASEEANQEDVAGGLGEKRIDAVWRKLRSQFAEDHSYLKIFLLNIVSES